MDPKSDSNYQAGTPKPKRAANVKAAPGKKTPSRSKMPKQTNTLDDMNYFIKLPAGPGMKKPSAANPAVPSEPEANKDLAVGAKQKKRAAQEDDAGHPGSSVTRAPKKSKTRKSPGPRKSTAADQGQSLLDFFVTEGLLTCLCAAALLPNGSVEDYDYAIGLLETLFAGHSGH